jgi:hypothetical protein
MEFKPTSEQFEILVTFSEKNVGSFAKSKLDYIYVWNLNQNQDASLRRSV